MADGASRLTHAAPTLRGGGDRGVAARVRGAGGRALRALVLLSLVWNLGGTALPGAVEAAAVAPVPITTGVPRFEAAPCTFALGERRVEGRDVNCGRVVVAAKHANPGGATITLPVAIYKARGATPAAEPIVMLAGGPGQSGQVFANVLGIDGPFYTSGTANNDVVFFDQRGTGKSQPSLDCPELSGMTIRGQYVRAFADSPFVAAINRCRDTLVGRGIDLGAYTTTENAADVNDVRLALGYPAMNIVGASYGSELGLAVARDFGQFVRTVNLASIVPLQQPWFFEPPQSFDRALNELFRDCAANAACNEANPNLKAAFQSTVATLDRRPVVLTLKDPASGETVRVPLDGVTYTAVLFQLFYSTLLVPFLPDMLTRASRNDFVWLENLLSQLFSEPGESLALGMHFSVACSKNPTQEQYNAAQAAQQTILPEVRAALGPQTDDYRAICANWPSRNADPKANVPVTSDRPTVLVSGQFDPITPPGYAEIAKRTLPNAVSVTLPGGGHSAIVPVTPVGACGFTVLFSNINMPGKPDTSCVGALKTTYRTLPPAIAGGPAPSPSPSASPSASPRPSASPAPSASPVPSASPRPSASPMPTATPRPSMNPVPSPPPTGSGGNLPGLPNTGAGGGAGGTGGVPGWLILLPFIALGALGVRRVRG